MGNVVMPLIIFGMVIMAFIWMFINVLSSDEIRVKEPLVYTTELVIENNQVDTIYVYKIP